MLYLALSYCIISVICITTGIVFYELAAPKNDAVTTTPPRPFIVYAITGLILITGIGQWIVLFLPLGISALLFVLLVIFVLLIRKKRVVLFRFRQLLEVFKSQLPVTWIAFLALFVMIATINAGPTMMDDTESYHIQLVKWGQEYGTVPGLANLHLRFGFNSSWFTAVGILSPAWAPMNTYLVLNGLFSLWLCQYFFEKLSYALAQRNNVNLFLGIFLLFLFALITWPMLRGSVPTVNYDFITCGCIIVLFIEACLAPRLEKEWILWPCFLFTVRIINYPILLLSVYCLWKLYKNHSFKQILLYITAGGLLIIPFVARNVLLSGYAFFPIYQVDLFQVDWKADQEMTINIVEYIKYYNRVNPMFKPLSETSLLAFPHWITPWFQHLFKYDLPVTIAGLLSFGVSLFRWQAIRQRFGKDALVFILILFVQVVSWFFVAPDPRFVYGPLLCAIFLVPFLLLSSPFPFTKAAGNIMSIAVMLVAAGVLFYTARKIIGETAYQNWSSPHKLPVPPVREVKVDGITIMIPERILDNWNPRCYGTSLPCLYRIHPRLRARGDTIADGFYIEKSNAGHRYNKDLYYWY